MRGLFTIAFFAVLLLLTLLAVRTWYASRGHDMEEAQRRVFFRFVTGLALFWLVAIAGYLGGFVSF